MLAVPWNRKLSEFSSEPFHGRKKWSEFRTVEQKQKQTLKILFRSISQKRKQLGMSFRGTKIKQTFGILFRGISRKKNRSKFNIAPSPSPPPHEVKSIQNYFLKISVFGHEVWTNNLVKLFWLFCKIYFLQNFIPFHSELRNWLFLGPWNASEMSRKEHFLPKNNKNRSGSIPGNFRCQPLPGSLKGGKIQVLS
jgi:hypothetical protein